MKEDVKITSGEVKALLANRFSPPQWAFFTEVANGTGGYRSGYADGVAFGLWPSTGFPIEGFEVKVARSDWLNELKKPEKSGQIFQYCDKWWLVAAKGVAKIEEIPKTWGFIEVVNGKLYTRKPAPDLERTEEVPVQFYAALLRRATESTVPRSTLHELVKKEREEIEARHEKRHEEASDMLVSYKEKVKRFEEASGLQVFGNSYWSPDSKELGEAVKFVLDGGLKGMRMDYNMESAIKDLRELVGKLETFDTMRKEFKI